MTVRLFHVHIQGQFSWERNSALPLHGNGESVVEDSNLSSGKCSHQLPNLLPWHAGDDDQSLVTLVVAPVSPMFAAVKQLTTSRIAGLQDFFAHYRANSPLATSASTIQSPEADLVTLSGWLL